MTSATGPGQKFDLGQAPPPGQPAVESPCLPEAYGTGQLLAIARDPGHLYAHWDLTADQQRHYNELASDRHLVLRVHLAGAEGAAPVDIHLQPQSRHWFVSVDRAGASYVLELGYYQADRQWVGVATSEPVTTPSKTVAEDKGITWATLPGSGGAAPAPESKPGVASQPTPRPGFPPLPLEWMPGFAPIPIGLIPAGLSEEVRAELFQASLHGSAATWSVSEERALAELLGLSLMQHSWPTREQIAALLARLGRVPSSISSPFGGQWAPRKGFWFNVNAELVIYGATEPDAAVAVGNRPVTLRPDGTFSLRVALPDGQHEVNATAVSAEGDFRQARMSFSRKTDYKGEVGQG